jgi:hypothetical protein
MSAREERRTHAANLHARAASLSHGKTKGRRRLRRQLAEASATVAEADAAIDALRARGYSQLPDGRWRNPDGLIVAGS